MEAENRTATRKTDKRASALIPTGTQETEGLDWTPQIYNVQTAVSNGAGYMRQYNGMTDDFIYRKFPNASDMWARLEELAQTV